MTFNKKERKINTERVKCCLIPPSKQKKAACYFKGKTDLMSRVRDDGEQTNLSQELN